MKPFFPVIELVDRYTIARLKFELTNDNLPEWEFYQAQLAGFDIKVIADQLEQLYEIHKKIWSLESELKSGAEAQLGLEEIGRRAIEIRDWNRQRIALKNHMADQLGQGHVQEIKHNHLSE
jgi:hypothetical protein